MKIIFLLSSTQNFSAKNHCQRKVFKLQMDSYNTGKQLVSLLFICVVKMFVMTFQPGVWVRIFKLIDVTDPSILNLLTIEYPVLKWQSHISDETNIINC